MANSFDALEPGELEPSEGDDGEEVATEACTLKRKLQQITAAPENNVKPRKSSKKAGRGFYDLYGEGAVAEITIKKDTFHLEEVQQLICFLLADGIRPAWAFVKNTPLIRQVVLVLLPGLDWPLQRRCRQHMPFCERVLGKPAVCRIDKGTQPAGAVLDALMTVAVSKSKQKEQKKSGKAAARHEPPPHPPTFYTLDLDTMRELKYPVPVVTADGKLQAPEGFVWSADNHSAASNGSNGTHASSSGSGAQDASTSGRPEAQWSRKGSPAVLDMPHLACGLTLYALDCEMCITARGFELTRISIVNHVGKCVMDELVVPDEPITDYNTQYSGITAEMLAGVKTRLPDIQRRLCALVTEGCILVGHSLENDFRALKFVHGNCIDTVQLYPHPKGLPHRSALRVLVERYLHRKIQQGSHDSVQDATAAMELALLKIKNGPAFGRNERSGEKLMSVLSRAQRRCSFIDRTCIVRKYVTGSCDGTAVETDSELVSRTCSEVQRRSQDQSRPANDLVVTRLLPLQTIFTEVTKELRASHGAGSQGGDERSDKAQQQAKQGAPSGAQHGLPSGEGPPGAVEAALAQMDSALERIWASAAPNTLFLAASLGGNTFYTRWLVETKLRREQGLDGLPPWTRTWEEHYAACYDDAIRGCCFAAVKP